MRTYHSADLEKMEKEGYVRCPLIIKEVIDKEIKEGKNYFVPSLSAMKEDAVKRKLIAYPMEHRINVSDLIKERIQIILKILCAHSASIC